VLPIVLYGRILPGALDAYLLAAPARPRLGARHDNLLPILPYWRQLLGALLAMAMATRYG
jgi:hypothetical protein